MIFHRVGPGSRVGQMQCGDFKDFFKIEKNSFVNDNEIQAVRLCLVSNRDLRWSSNHTQSMSVGSEERGAVECPC